MTFFGTGCDGTGRTNGRKNIGTDRLFSENIILDGDEEVMNPHQSKYSISTFDISSMFSFKIHVGAERSMKNDSCENLEYVGIPASHSNIVQR